VLLLYEEREQLRKLLKPESKANEEENIVPFREKEQKGEEPNEDNLVPFRGINRDNNGKFSKE